MERQLLCAQRRAVKPDLITHAVALNRSKATCYRDVTEGVVTAVWSYCVKVGEVGTGEVEDVGPSNRDVAKVIRVDATSIGPRQQLAHEAAASEGEGVGAADRHADQISIVDTAPTARDGCCEDRLNSSS